MRRKKTHEEFVKEMGVKNPNIEILGKYNGAKHKILCRCMICNCQWYATPDNLLYGKGCPKCADKSKKEKQRKSHEEFIRNLKEINANIIVLGTYINNSTKLLCKCSIDGYEWYATPRNLLSGYGCPKCGGSINKTHSDFIKEMNLRFPDIEILGEYVNCKTKLLCRCKICNHTWYAIPSNLLSGIGCPNCNKSHGERKIDIFLSKYNIENIPQKRFDDLIGNSGKCLSFDFYIPKYNILIEYQGIQHYEPVRFGSISLDQAKNNFKIQQIYDNFKRGYAKLHNIQLLEIPYWDFDNIEQILESRLLLKQSA